MEFYTMDRGFLKQAEIDKFTSGIWTERYYGDSEFQLIVPATKEMADKLAIGTFLGEVGSKEVMMIENIDIEGNDLKLSGISLLPWLNNRFIRASVSPEDKYWNTSPVSPGYAIWSILYNWCVVGSPYLNGTYNIGVPNPSRFAIPYLSIKSFDNSGPLQTFAVPYGPVYDAMKAIATTYQLGMTITLEYAVDVAYSLQFLCYKGIDRTSRQSSNLIVRFSEEMDTLTDIKELQSIKDAKTLVYSFASVKTTDDPPVQLSTSPGESHSSESTGFDLRALMTFEEDINTDQVGGNSATLLSILNERANKALNDHRVIKTVDGEIVPAHQFQYGVDYALGDLIEVQGRSGVVQISRVTEHIRTHDSTGEKSYPTVAMLE